MWIALLALALLPGFVLVVYFKKKDAFQPEPWSVIWRSFFAGAVLTLPAGFIEVALMDEPSGHAFLPMLFYCMVVIALVEELCKLAGILAVPARDPHFDEPVDGIVYGAAVAAGFATVENVFYVLDGGFGVAVIRAVLSVPLHILQGAIIGYWTARVRISKSTTPLRGYGWALFITVSTHGLFDFACLYDGMGALLLLALPALLIVNLVIVRRYLVETLAESLVAPEPSPPADAPPTPEWPRSRHAASAAVLFMLGTLFVCFGAFLVLGVVGTALEGELEAVFLLFPVFPLFLGIWLIRKGRSLG